jgi:hypothetical protein
VEPTPSAFREALDKLNLAHSIHAAMHDDRHEAKAMTVDSYVALLKRAGVSYKQVLADEFVVAIKHGPVVISQDPRLPLHLLVLEPDEVALFTILWPQIEERLAEEENGSESSGPVE